MHFSAIGFSLQGVSMFCESIKLTLQSHSLSSDGRKLDAFTYVMLVAPMVLIILLGALVGFAVAWPERPEALRLPPWYALVENRGVLLANGSLAFAMQIAHAAFMKNSSAITFILTGVVMKDIVVIAVCAVVLGEELSGQQLVGFSIQLLGVCAWSLMKVVPGLVGGAGQASGSLPPLPRGATGLIAACEPETDTLIAGLRLKVEDLSAGERSSSFCKEGMRRIPTVSSESTMTPLGDSFDEEANVITPIRNRESNSEEEFSSYAASFMEALSGSDDSATDGFFQMSNSGDEGL